MAADGSDAPQRVAPGMNPQPSSWSIDDVLAFVDRDDDNDIWMLRMDGKSQPVAFLQTSAQERYPEFSPDGKWIAYASDEMGAPAVFVRPYPEGVPLRRISAGRGMAPFWSREGNELFYLDVDGDTVKVMVVDVATEPPFTQSPPRLLFEGPFGVGGPVRIHDISPDGQRFVFVTKPASREPEPVTRIDIVLNWFEELKERVPVPKEAEVR